MFRDEEIAEYNRALVRALRSTDPEQLRAFAASWGQRLGNRGLLQLARASREQVERRMWLMINDRPDLEDRHAEAQTWLSSHPAEDAR